MKVKDAMTTKLIVVHPDTPVKEIAEIMLKNRIGGVPVVDNEKLVGIVTEEDLIMKNVKLHFPTYIQLLDAVIYLESLKKYEEELRRAVGATAKDVMSKELITISPEASLEDAATLMVEKGISRLPVVENDKLVGIVTKRDILRHISKEL
ncbi:MAG: CBS domain-containing protein [Actinobacteria bacterium]|nr:CBS domain-containing protein [Actinomycetota bacterium]